MAFHSRGHLTPIFHPRTKDNFILFTKMPPKSKQSIPVSVTVKRDNVSVIFLFKRSQTISSVKKQLCEMLNSAGAINGDSAENEETELKIPKSSFALTDDEDDDALGFQEDRQAESSNESKETEKLDPKSIKIALIKELSPLRVEAVENSTKIQEIMDQNDREVYLAFALDDEEFNVVVPSQEEQ